MGKQMEGDNRQRRKAARKARDRGQQPSEIGATLGASKQRAETDESQSHQKQIDQQRQGKQAVTGAHTPAARPGSRDADTPDQERHPRLQEEGG